MAESNRRNGETTIFDQITQTPEKKNLAQRMSGRCREISAFFCFSEQTGHHSLQLMCDLFQLHANVFLTTLIRWKCTVFGKAIRSKIEIDKN